MGGFPGWDVSLTNGGSAEDPGESCAWEGRLEGVLSESVSIHVREGVLDQW